MLAGRLRHLLTAPVIQPHVQIGIAALRRVSLAAQQAERRLLRIAQRPAEPLRIRVAPQPVLIAGLGGAHGRMPTERAR